MSKMILKSLSPMIVQDEWYVGDDPDPRFTSVVLNPMWDGDLIEFIKKHDIQPGEFIEAKP